MYVRRNPLPLRNLREILEDKQIVRLRRKGGIRMKEDFLVECMVCGWIVLSQAPCKCTEESE